MKVDTSADLSYTHTDKDESVFRILLPRVRVTKSLRVHLGSTHTSVVENNSTGTVYLPRFFGDIFSKIQMTLNILTTHDSVWNGFIVHEHR